MFDLYPYKVKDTIVKTLKVVGWLVASGAVTALLAYTQEMPINADNAALTGLMMIVNAGLVFVVDYLRKIDPRRAQTQVPAPEAQG